MNDLFDYLLAIQKGGGGGGGDPEIFEAILEETTYEEIDTAYNTGKIVLLKDDSNKSYLAGIPIYIDGKYIFHIIAQDGTVNTAFVGTDGWGTNTAPGIFWATNRITPFAEIYNAYSLGKFCVLVTADGIAVLKECRANQIEFVTSIDSSITYYTCNANNEWGTYSYETRSIYFVQPNNTSFMDIVNAVEESRLPVINDLANGRAYYVSGYTMNGEQPTAVTFSTITASDPHTWTVDYQDNWTST